MDINRDTLLKADHETRYMLICDLLQAIYSQQKENNALIHLRVNAMENKFDNLNISERISDVEIKNHKNTIYTLIVSSVTGLIGGILAVLTGTSFFAPR
jgi:alcohol dehydrogenase YqhD (iron-dependent ADH family)